MQANDLKLTTIGIQIDDISWWFKAHIWMPMQCFVDELCCHTSWLKWKWALFPLLITLELVEVSTCWLSSIFAGTQWDNVGPMESYGSHLLVQYERCIQALRKWKLKWLIWLVERMVESHCNPLLQSCLWFFTLRLPDTTTMSTMGLSGRLWNDDSPPNQQMSQCHILHKG